jgi:hypothetical protein
MQIGAETWPSALSYIQGLRLSGIFHDEVANGSIFLYPCISQGFVRRWYMHNGYLLKRKRLEYDVACVTSELEFAWGNQSVNPPK